MSSGLTYGSVCSGIGGLDLGFDRQGFRCLWQCEIDPYAQSILRRHWNVPLYDDIRKIGREREHQAERPDVLIGGFPCQDVSTANPNATGLQGERSGPIFHEIVRLTREFRPRYVVLENVSALTHRGLEEVLAEFHLCGYDVRWDIVSAASVGAEHRRDRIFIIAVNREISDTGGVGLLHRQTEEQSAEGWVDALCDVGSSGSVVPDTTLRRGELRPSREPFFEGSDEEKDADRSYSGNVSLAPGEGRERKPSGVEGLNTQCGEKVPGRNDTGDVQNSRLLHRREEIRSKMDSLRQDEERFRSAETGAFGNTDSCRRLALAGIFSREPSRSDFWLPESRLGGAADGIPTGLDQIRSWERGTPRIAGRSKHRLDRLRCLGNAVVPQVAEHVAKCLREYHEQWGCTI